MGCLPRLNVFKDTTVRPKLLDLTNMPARKESMALVQGWSVKVNAQIVPEEVTATYQDSIDLLIYVTLGKGEYCESDDSLSNIH